MTSRLCLCRNTTVGPGSAVVALARDNSPGEKKVYCMLSGFQGYIGHTTNRRRLVPEWPNLIGCRDGGIEAENISTIASLTVGRIDPYFHLLALETARLVKVLKRVLVLESNT